MKEIYNINFWRDRGFNAITDYLMDGINCWLNIKYCGETNFFWIILVWIRTLPSSIYPNRHMFICWPHGDKASTVTRREDDQKFEKLKKKTYLKRRENSGRWKLLLRHWANTVRFRGVTKVHGTPRCWKCTPFLFFG